uniref:Uncharacterized protein n=1 Tax=Tanacetum cinerariifolium TaxID=118510 RepID=A0A699HEY8_TANCI|nr:hypothetical protein [Tanacetum cinerariifolium]
MFVDLEISTQTDGAQSSRVPVPLFEDPYKAIRQAYLVRTNVESKPFEDLVETETSESPYTVATPTCHVEELEGSGMSGARSMSSDSTAPLSPDHPLTHTTSVLVPSLCKTARMTMCVSHAMSFGISISIVEVAAMSDSTFRKRFRSFYDSSPSPTFPVRKRYRGMSCLILDNDSEGDDLGDEDDKEEVEESSYSDSESDDAEDTGPVTKDEEPAARGRGLFEVGKSSGFVRESERPERVLALRQPTLTTWIDPEDGIAYIDVLAYPPPTPPVQTPLLPEWSSSSLFISPGLSIVPSPISSPMISLTVPLPVASPSMAKAEGFLAELGAQVEMRGGLIRDHTVRLGELSPTLFERYDRDIWELFTRPVLALEAWAGHVDTRMVDMSRAGYDDHRLVYDMLLQQAALQRELQEMRGRVTALE